MNHLQSSATYFVCCVCLLHGAAVAEQATDEDGLRGVMLSDQQITAAELQRLRKDGTNTIVLQLDGQSVEERQREIAAARLVHASGLQLYYWIEIAHCPELADAHPEWMASLQGHQEWRRLFKDPPTPKKNVETIKNYPWVPILYQESFEAHRKRVARLLDGMPAATAILLNDLQGAPSACGCGNPLCRWTADYGPVKTATVRGSDAAANFVQAVAELVPESKVIPVWLTECEEHDGAKDGLCAGVGCFGGICWKAWTEQLTPVAKQSDEIAVMLPYRALDRDLEGYGGEAAWISHGLEFFQTMPPRHDSPGIPAERLIAILQGWDVTDAQISAQKTEAIDSGAAGFIVSHTKIDQSWEPRLHRIAP